MRGAFVRGDGLVIPNNITNFGVQFLLSMIFDSSRGDSLYIGMGSAVYDPALTTPQVNEPSQIGGYARVAMPRDLAHWSAPAVLNCEYYVESIPVVFAAVGTGFSVPVTRMFLTDGAASLNLIALSGAFPAALQVNPDTPVQQRTFKYRLYLR